MSMTTQRPRAAWSTESACLPLPDLYVLSKKPTTQDYEEQESKLGPNCNACPVLRECRNYALVHENDGYWGGTSERDRKQLRKKNQESQTELIRQASQEGWLEHHAILPNAEFAAVFLGAPQVDFGPATPLTEAEERVLSLSSDELFPDLDWLTAG